jgi:CBS domain-containing protein
MKAGDIMNRDVVSVRPETPVGEIAEMLLEHGISAVPVLDAAGGILGIVSEDDLIRRHDMGTERRRPWWLALFADSATLASEYARSRGRTAADVMVRDVICVTEDTPAGDIANLLETHHIKRVLVAEQNKVIGIVSRANILQALASRRQEQDTPASSDDRSIRERLIGELKTQKWVPFSKVNFIVSDGTVHLWGHVRSEEERTALRVAATNTPGVRDVKDHLNLLPVRVLGRTL